MKVKLSTNKIRKRIALSRSWKQDLSQRNNIWIYSGYW